MGIKQDKACKAPDIHLAYGKHPTVDVREEFPGLPCGGAEKVWNHPPRFCDPLFIRLAFILWGRRTCVNPSLTRSLVSDLARELGWSGHPLEEELHVVSHSDIQQRSGGAAADCPLSPGRKVSVAVDTKHESK